MLRSLVLCSAASLAFATGAMGADLPDTKGPPAFTPPPPAFSWTGFYVGVNVDYGIGDDPTTESTVSGAAFPIIPPGTPIYGTPGSFTIAPQGVIVAPRLGLIISSRPTS